MFLGAVRSGKASLGDAGEGDGDEFLGRGVRLRCLPVVAPNWCVSAEDFPVSSPRRRRPASTVLDSLEIGPEQFRNSFSVSNLGGVRVEGTVDDNDDIFTVLKLSSLILHVRIGPRAATSEKGGT